MKITEIEKEELSGNIEIILGAISDVIGINLEYDYTIETYTDESGEEVEYIALKLFSEEHESLLIGYHGQTLDRLEYLVQTSLHNRYKDRIRLSLDISDYRAGRLRTLESIARRAMQQVVETGQEMELEPMRASERRFVHNFLSEGDSAVTTESRGEGRDRHIVIMPLVKESGDLT